MNARPATRRIHSCLQRLCLLQRLPLPLLLPGWIAALAAQFGDSKCASNSTEITITGHIGSGGAENVPEAVDGLPVGSIAFAAFSGGGSLTSITNPDSVNSVFDNPFDGCCTSLTSVQIPKSTMGAPKSGDPSPQHRRPNQLVRFPCFRGDERSDCDGSEHEPGQPELVRREHQYAHGRVDRLQRSCLHELPQPFLPHSLAISLRIGEI